MMVEPGIATLVTMSCTELVLAVSEGVMVVGGRVLRAIRMEMNAVKRAEVQSIGLPTLIVVLVG